MAILARDKRFNGLVVSRKNAPEAAVVEEIEVIGIGTLAEAVGFLTSQLPLEPTSIDINAVLADPTARGEITVPPGFVVDTLLGQIDGTAMQLEAKVIGGTRRAGVGLDLDALGLASIRGVGLTRADGWAAGTAWTRCLL